MTFWEHLDELRGSLIRMAVAVVACAIVAFLFKEELFDIILAPQDEGFITYRLLDKVSQALMPSAAAVGGLDVQLINTGLAHQFLLHVRASLYAGVLVTLPYLIYQLFRFVSPALYVHERRHAVRRTAQPVKEDAPKHHAELVEIHVVKPRTAVEHHGAKQHVAQPRIVNIRRNYLPCGEIAKRRIERVVVSDRLAESVEAVRRPR
jgi:hypothetical protein